MPWRYSWNYTAKKAGRKGVTYLPSHCRSVKLPVSHGYIRCVEKTMADASEYPPYIDRRDAEVVEKLEVGKRYSVTTLEKLYKWNTDIRQDSTARQRKDHLFDSPCMEYAGTPGYVEFVGFEDE